MRKFLPALVIASCTLGLGLAAGSLATASYAPESFDEDFGHAADVADIPLPVAGSDLFVGQAACMDRDRVIALFLGDQTDLGGRTVKVADDRRQAFSDLWRDLAGLSPVAVTGIVAHVFPVEGVEWTVDVVEFDAAGCAMTRTLMPAALWSEILRGTGAA